jgi:hypothetical protein
MPPVIHRRGRTMNAENHTEILLARGRRLQELPGAPLPVAAISTSPDSSDGLRLTCARTLDRRAERRRMPFDAASRASRITPPDLVSRCGTDRTLAVPRRANKVAVDPLRLVSRVNDDARRRAVWANAASQRLYE